MDITFNTTIRCELNTKAQTRLLTHLKSIPYRFCLLANQIAKVSSFFLLTKTRKTCIVKLIRKSIISDNFQTC